MSFKEYLRESESNWSKISAPVFKFFKSQEKVLGDKGYRESTKITYPRPGLLKGEDPLEKSDSVRYIVYIRDDGRLTWHYENQYEKTRKSIGFFIKKTDFKNALLPDDKVKIDIYGDMDKIAGFKPEMYAKDAAKSVKKAISYFEKQEFGLENND